ncbi:MAG: hypothetical protein NTV94_02660 [Planctomycetota bacterium]|nr:hypothetical protein [Planctomycetota bacterium]
MKNVAAIRLAAIAGTALAASSMAQTTATWLTATNGNWSDATRWSTNPQVPNNSTGNRFNVFLTPTGSAYDVSLDIPVSIDDLTLNSPAATLRLTGSNGLTVNQAFTFASSQIRGTSYIGTMRVKGRSTFQGIQFDSIGDAFFDGGIDFTGIVADDINDTCVVHGGNGRWLGNRDIRLNGTTELMILRGSTFTISSAGTLSWNQLGSMGALDNRGSIIKTAGGTTNFTDVQFHNTGTLDVRAGTVSANNYTVTGGILAEGTWKVSGGASIDLQGVAVTTNNADVTLDGAGSTFAAINALSTNASTGKLSILGGRTFTTTGNFTNNGRLTVGSGSTFAVVGGSTLTNYNVGTSTLSGGIFDVRGVLRFGTGTTIATLDASVTLNGPTARIESNSGANTLAATTKITTNGSLALKGGATFTTTGNFLVEGNNSGIIDVEAGSEFAIGNGFSLQNYDLGTKTLSQGDFRIAGKITFDHSGIERLDSKLTLDGTLAQVVDSANIDALVALKNIDGFGALTLSNNASFTANPTDAPSFVFTVAPTGRVNVNSGSQLDILGDLVNYSGGTFTDGDFNVQGTLRARNITNVETISNAIALAGTTARITNFNNTDVFETVKTITPAGNFCVSNGRQLTLTDSFGLTNQGTFTVGGTERGDTTVVTINQNLLHTPSATTVVRNDARLLVQSGCTIQGGTFTVDSGHLDVVGSILHTGGTVTVAGAGLITAGGQYLLTAGELALAGGEINAAGGLQQTGGVITGNGVINGALISGGIISPAPGFPSSPATQLAVSSSPDRSHSATQAASRSASAARSSGSLVATTSSPSAAASPFSKKLTPQSASPWHIAPIRAMSSSRSSTPDSPATSTSSWAFASTTTCTSSRHSRPPA